MKRLSARETEVLTLIARGYTDKLIAQEMHIKRQTVRNHIASIREKCEALNRTHAVFIALQHGLIAFPEDNDQQDINRSYEHID